MLRLLATVVAGFGTVLGGVGLFNAATGSHLGVGTRGGGSATSPPGGVGSLLLVIAGLAFFYVGANLKRWTGEKGTDWAARARKVLFNAAWVVPLGAIGVLYVDDRAGMELVALVFYSPLILGALAQGLRVELEAAGAFKPKPPGKSLGWVAWAVLAVVCGAGIWVMISLSR